jgi:hypothetical protein
MVLRDRQLFDGLILLLLLLLLFQLDLPRARCRNRWSNDCRWGCGPPLPPLLLLLLCGLYRRDSSGNG